MNSYFLEKQTCRSSEIFARRLFNIETREINYSLAECDNDFVVRALDIEHKRYKCFFFNGGITL